ncbi:hypothetical protein, partial [Sinobacterium caligoides]|uniref:hypothetical protein n=1 Tax=Sinobacterium caligoides TaxID=933926 RepID=UPI0013C37BF5
MFAREFKQRLVIALVLFVCFLSSFSQARTTIFQYDDANRLVSAGYDDDKKLVYYYDAMGNRLIHRVVATDETTEPPASFTLNMQNDSVISYGAGVTLNWGDASTAEAPLFYEVYFGSTDDPELYTTGVTEPSLFIAALPSASSYYWRVVAVAIDGTRVSSETVRILPLDTDSDGIPDHIEDGLCTDSTKLDSDGDGLSDAEEDINSDGFLDIGESYACIADSDGDGILDGWEVVNGLNPLDGTDAQEDHDGDGFITL